MGFLLFQTLKFLKFLTLILNMINGDEHNPHNSPYTFLKSVNKSGEQNFRTTDKGYWLSSSIRKIMQVKIVNLKKSLKTTIWH